ncbi:3-isopropylmalate dehydratase small subunit [Pseudogracilibacillus auburnensis]|uniref:3-isopropylmalate dehydratase small subunit n=1 Tax=Pseudogracilibacillus auburnensis TaxID=1494959 RepID=A0A2V3W0R5_9BACI|nr:3-isopropylmalate dehydratase small subunit [Pseudogracilibacillus auburnensis]MBO1002042.1 3-isopropylmalate dehydratase small subunit [Pseudogracilibacillus auburnensis]PXW87366.1 3-isopropylmalate dehydratase small subunit [Pseudogracilibacillus auburnensis]
MEAIKNHTGLVYPLNRTNVDTDQIIPKQFLKRIERTGFGQFLFYHWRFDDEGNKRESFSLNDPKYEHASILIAGDNFGCGSSREHAPWSLMDFGFRVIIAPSFADIFYNNSFKNGLVPIKVDEEQVNKWLEQAAQSELTLTVDLEEKTITDNNNLQIAFDIPEYNRQNLLNGWDEIALTLQLEDKISKYEQTTL